jgi:beta-lactamase superfamily II metal-dependent hydrolase
MVTDRYPGRSRSRIPATALLLLLLALGACDGGGSTAPETTPPAITISGVEDGGTYGGPVTIGIAVDRGSYEATLNGQAFSSGTVVSTPGAHTLSVTARNGLATASRQLGFSIAAPDGGALIIRLIDLGPDTIGGGGDAILVTDSSAAGRVHALIDAGPSFFGSAHVANRLAALGVDTLAFMLLTHAHGDHYGGMTAVLNGMTVRRFYYNGQVRNLSGYNNVINLATSRADSVIILRDTLPVAFGRSAVQARFTLIHGLPAYLNMHTNDGALLNEGSLGASLRRAGFSMFFTGDGEYQANARWRTQFAAYTRNVTALKVGHHGANNAIFDSGTTGPSTWIEHTAPAVAVISSNGVSHPRVRALTRLLERSNTRTYCTSVHGEIAIRVWADGTYQVAVERAAGDDCRPGTQADS